MSTIRDSSDIVRRLDALTIDKFARFSGCIAGRDDDRPTVSADALLEHASVKLQRIRRDRGSSGIPEARSRR
jgi:hypothetical protein